MNVLFQQPVTGFGPADYIQFFIAILTLAIATSAIVQVYIARDTARKQLRAYISIDQVTLAPLAVGESLNYVVALKNCGMTPAAKVAIWSGIVPRDIPVTNPFDHQRGAIVQRGSTGPGQGVMLSGTSTYVVEQIFIDRVAAGAAGVFIYGEATYVDIYGRSRTTAFRFVHGGPWGNAPGSTWRTADGNDAS